MGKIGITYNKIKIVLGAILDGSAFEYFFLKHFRFIMFFLFIVVMYVGNRYGYDDTVRKIDQMEERIRELKDVSATISGNLMTASRPSEVSALVKEKGLRLEFSVTPPTAIDPN